MSAPDVRSFTVGAVQENCYIVRADAQAKRAVIVDPGDEPERLLEAVEALGVTIEAILLTHCHFDHIGAVAPVARATGAPVYCPKIERAAARRRDALGAARLRSVRELRARAHARRRRAAELAGMEIDVIFTPGHSPGHLTYATGDALLSGDVLFQGSVGRVDLPGGDWGTLERSIEGSVRAYPRETVVYPGHMGVTTLGRELADEPVPDRAARAPRSRAAREPARRAPAAGS